MPVRDVDDIIDEFLDALDDFDAVLRWAKVLKVEINYPPIDDMWPDWQNELTVEVGDAMREVCLPLRPKEHLDT